MEAMIGVSTDLSFQLLGKLRQEYGKFKASVANFFRLCLKIKSKKRAGGCSSVVEYLPSECKVLGSILSTAKKISK